VTDIPENLRQELDQLKGEVQALKIAFEGVQGQFDEKVKHLEEENDGLKHAPRRGALTMKVSAKGALSIYGLGRFPVTLYKEQWERLLGASDDIHAFLAENEALLKSKE
jgi:hypothetical protein